jgi:hypothetical protein
MACTLSDLEDRLPAARPRDDLSPSAAMTVVAAGMAVTAATATALAPIRQAGRRDQPWPSWAPAPAAPGST